MEQINKCFKEANGHISYDKSWDGYNYCISHKEGIRLLLNYFKKYPLLTTQSIQTKTLGRILYFIDEKYHFINHPYKFRIDN